MLDTLLLDYTTGENIIFATDGYAIDSPSMSDCDRMTLELLLGFSGVIQPRVNKNAASQAVRTRKKAEVFTPTWIIRKMIDYIDDNFSFSGDWQGYVDARCLEITCGEAPFLVNRYDAATGEEIVITERTGILDRKLRLVGENTAHNMGEWLEGAKRALQSVYGYEFQGDSLLIARINLLVTFVDYMEYYCGVMPTQEQLMEAAEIIACNLWQMDGLTGAIPYATPTETQLSFSFSGECENSSDCKILEWNSGREYLWRDVEGGQGMKFDFVIGNPPYQEETIGDNKAFAPPVYDKFMDAAYKISDKVILIHPARFLFNAGSTSKDWNKKMLEDEHFKVLEYSENSAEHFRNTEIKGGVAISYRDAKKNFGAIKVFSMYKELNVILKKAAPSTDEESLMSIIYIQNRFDLDALYEEYPHYKLVIGSEGKDKRFRNNIFDKIDIFSEEKQNNDDFRIIGVVRNKRQWRYIPSNFVDKSHPNIYKWKTLVVRVNGTGKLGEVLSSPLIAGPNEGYTQTFIGIGAFESKKYAENALKYVKSKFARTMLAILKKTQDNNRDTWKYVPLQNFTNESDIDWSVSIADIDRQLYKKYGLTPEEIDFVETHVKEMT